MLFSICKMDPIVTPKQGTYQHLQNIACIYMELADSCLSILKPLQDVWIDFLTFKKVE